MLTTCDAICAVTCPGSPTWWMPASVSGTVELPGVTDRARSGSGIVGCSGIATRHSGRYLAGGSNSLVAGHRVGQQTLYPDATRSVARWSPKRSEAPPGAAGLTFLPYLLGERAPACIPPPRPGASV